MAEEEATNDVQCNFAAERFRRRVARVSRSNRRRSLSALRYY